MRIEDEGKKMQLVGIVEQMAEWMEWEILAKIGAELGPRTVPGEISGLQSHLRNIKQVLMERPLPEVHDSYLPALKLAILQQRLRRAKELEGFRRKTNNAAVIQTLEGRLKPYEALMSEAWFKAVNAARLPQ